MKNHQLIACLGVFLLVSPHCLAQSDTRSHRRLDIPSNNNSSGVRGQFDKLQQLMRQQSKANDPTQSEFSDADLEAMKRLAKPFLDAGVTPDPEMLPRDWVSKIQNSPKARKQVENLLRQYAESGQLPPSGPNGPTIPRNNQPPGRRSQGNTNRNQPNGNRGLLSQPGQAPDRNSPPSGRPAPENTNPDRPGFNGMEGRDDAQGNSTPGNNASPNSPASEVPAEPPSDINDLIDNLIEQQREAGETEPLSPNEVETPANDRLPRGLGAEPPATPDLLQGDDSMRPLNQRSGLNEEGQASESMSPAATPGDNNSNAQTIDDFLQQIQKLPAPPEPDRSRRPNGMNPEQGATPRTNSKPVREDLGLRRTLKDIYENSLGKVQQDVLQKRRQQILEQQERESDRARSSGNRAGDPQNEGPRRPAPDTLMAPQMPGGPNAGGPNPGEQPSNDFTPSPQPGFGGRNTPSPSGDAEASAPPTPSAMSEMLSEIGDYAAESLSDTPAPRRSSSPDPIGGSWLDMVGGETRSAPRSGGSQKSAGENSSGGSLASSLDGVSVGDFWAVGFVLFVIAALVILILAGRFFKKDGAIERAVARAHRLTAVSMIRSRADIVAAFHALALHPQRDTQEWWTHQRAAKEMSQESPNREEPAGQLAGLYEYARYLPDDAELTPEQIESAQAAALQCRP